MEYRRFENTIIARIDKGEEILEQVKIIALTENIQLASVQALGCLLYTSIMAEFCRVLTDGNGM